MGVDLNWQMLTDASANFGNALVNAAGTVHQRREQGRDRTALTNYLQHPDDQAAMSGLAGRNPALAFQIQDHHLEAARALRTEHQQQLDYLGQILTNPDGTPISDEASYQRARGLAQQAGIDTTGHETFDPAFVGQIVQLHQRLHPVAPVSVAEGARLVNPQTGAEVAAGNPRPPRYYPVQPGGTLVRDPSYQGGAAPAPAASPGPQDVIAVNPTTGARLRLNPQTQQWEPLEGGAGPQTPQTFPRQDGGAFDFNINPPRR